MIGLPDEGWLALGRNAKDEPLPIHYRGWMYRLDDDGDSLWSRSDTAIWGPIIGTGNSLNSVVVLPSGSIIAAGICEVFHPQLKNYGWLIKVDKNGCIDTLNCTPLNSINYKIFKNKINIYPNPTHSMINIESKYIDTWDRIEIIDASGHIIKVLQNATEKKISLIEVSDGVYFIRLTKYNESVVKKIIKR
jgi:hypothetical protein